MYAALWRRLPGNRLVKSLLALLVASAMAVIILAPWRMMP